MNYTVAGDGGFGGHIQYDGNTKFIKIPKDLNKDSGYSIENESALWGSNNSRPVIIYACDPNSLIADYVVLKPKDSDSESNIVGISRTMVAVEKIYTGMYEDETVKIISGMSIKDSNLSEVKLMSRKDELIDSNGNKCSYFDSVTDTLLSKVDGKLNHYTIEEGDIIRCIYDEDGFVSAVELLYRPTAINPEFPNGVKGTILGSTGYYQSGVGNSNPFALKDDGSTENTNNKYWGHNACRFIYGFVYKTQQNLVQYTTLDLTQNQFDNGGYNGRYINEIIRMAENRMITVTYKGGNVKVTRGKISDVKSFEDEGTNCSRIIANCYWGTDSYIIMINGSMD
jgi:hypothetical protein